MAINVRNERRTPALFPVTALTGGLIGGVLVGKQAPLTFDKEQVLKMDKFEISGKASKTLSDENKNAITEINNNLQSYKNASSSAENISKELFKEKEEINISEFLKASEKEAPKKGFRAFLSKLFGSKKPKKELTPEKIIESFENKIRNKSENLAELKNRIETSPKNITEDTLNAMKNSLKKITEDIETDSARLKFVKEASKDGKITKEAYNANITKNICDSAVNGIEKSFDSLKNISVKVPSIGKALLGAAVGVVAAFIIKTSSANKTANNPRQYIA